jgi:2,3-bisphosphoglycerate-dependent phosphoglycerate mutase
MLNKIKLLPIVKNQNKQFLLVRHGESIWNQDSKFTGWTNIPLTDNGKYEAKMMSHVLKYNKLYPNIIFSSVLDRAIQTSNIIKNELNNDNIQIQTSWRLNEKHYGTLEGIPRNHIRNIYGDIFTKMMRSNYYMKPPIIKNYNHNNKYQVYRNCYFDKIKDGESKENVLDRFLPYYQNDILYTLSENKFPLIVTHKHVARVLMKFLLKLDDQEFESYELPNKKILLINLNDNLTYNYHLEISY